MAIDTRDKRSSAILPGSPWRAKLPVPDSSLNSADWQHVAFAYRGIAAQQTLYIVSNPTIEAFTSTATATVPAVATADITIDAFTSTAEAVAPATLEANPTIAAFTSTATVLPGWALVAEPTIAAFTSTCTTLVLVQLQANINMQEFTAEAFIAGSTFGKYTIRGRGSGRRITCRPPPL